MAFFNNLKNAANVMGKSAKNVINTTATDSKEKSELSEIKRSLQLSRLTLKTDILISEASMLNI